MKIKKQIITFIILVISVVILASCGKPSTLEEYINKDSDAKAEIEKIAETSGLSVNVKENTLEYGYDVSTISDAFTEEIAMDSETKKEFESALESQKSVFENLCKTLEEASEVEGVKVLVKYTYKDKTIAEKTFTNN